MKIGFFKQPHLLHFAAAFVYGDSFWVNALPVFRVRCEIFELKSLTILFAHSAQKPTTYIAFQGLP
jgi:hypothetical protein